MSNGKGSSPRPFSVDPDTYADNYQRTFGVCAVERVKKRDTCVAQCTDATCHCGQVTAQDTEA